MTAIETLITDMAKASLRERERLVRDIDELASALERLKVATVESRRGISNLNLAQLAANIEHRAVRIDATEEARRDIRDATEG